MDRIICPSCGEECDGGFVDLGVGVTEYWGNVQNHEDIRYVSDCCWADIPEPDFDDYP